MDDFSRDGWLREIAGNRPCQGTDLMIPDDDPLWYDRAEPDEPLGPTVWILMGAFVVGEFAYKLATGYLRTLRVGIVMAFRDVKP